MIRKLKVTSGIPQENSFIVVPRVKLYVPKEESFLVPIKYIDVTRTSCTSLDVMLEKQIEDLDGKKELSDAWSGFTRLDLLKERPPEGFSWSGWKLTRKQKNFSSWWWPDMWKFMSDAAKKKAKQIWAVEKPKLDNARQLRGIFFIEPNDEEFKLTMKAARRKLDVPMAAAMPLQNTDMEQWRNPPQYWETQDKIRLCCWCRRKHETNARRSWTQTSSRTHHCKRDEFFDSLQSRSQIHSDASINENYRRKGGSGERMGKTGENPGMAADESQKQKRGDRWCKK